MSEPFDRVVRAAARRARADGVCPKPEVLASYLDNGLTSDERAAVEAHAADCLRCQQHLSLLGAVSVERPHPDAIAPRPWLVRWGWLVPVATAVLVVAVWTRTPAPVDAPAQFPQREVAPAVVPAPEPPAATSAPPAKAEAGRERQDFAAKVAPQAMPAAPAPTAERDQVGQLADAAAPPAEAESKEAAAGAAPMREEARLMRKAAAPPIEVAASDRERYRAAGGRIERSRDNGASWQEVFSDAGLSFTAVACAPGGACWFGTSTGVVLRSGDGGFSRSRLPEPGAVTAIDVTSPAQVTITAGNRRYRTSDGSSWTSVP